MTGRLKIICSNCQGLNNHKKRGDVFENLKKKKGDIDCIQDTHFTKDLEQKIKLEWGSSETRFSYYTSQSRDVAILFRDSFEFKILEEINDNENGNYLILKMKIDDEIMSLTCLYGPNADTPDFYKNLMKLIKFFRRHQFLIPPLR